MKAKQTVAERYQQEQIMQGKGEAIQPSPPQQQPQSVNPALAQLNLLISITTI